MIPLTHVKMIPFTQREMSRAYRQAKEAAKVNVRTNAHRLLLFYAVECGLKVAYMRQQNISIFDAAIADQIRHNLNDLMAKN